jgi:ABC-type multidrug transport system fused ATPase/permease subunit
MKVLFLAIFRVKNHSLLFIFSILTLIGLTIFNQLEMFVFGAIAKTAEAIPGLKIGKVAIIVDQIKNYLGLDSESFYSIVLLFVVVGVGKALFMFFNKYLTKILAVRICRDLRNQCFATLQKLPLSFFGKFDRGKLSTRVITDANQISLSFNSFVVNYIQMPFIVVSTLLICLTLSWQLTAVLFVGIPLIVLPLRLITRKLRRISHSMQRKQESFISIIIDHLSGIFTIKSYQLEKYSIRKYSEENARIVAFDEKIQKYDSLTRPITHFLMTVMLVGIAYIGIHVLCLSFPDLIVYCGVLHMLYSPLKQFSEENANVQRGIVAASRLYDIMGASFEEEDLNKMSIKPFEQTVSFSNVCFSYGDLKILQDISFTLKKGEVLAIVGSTGSGKSTLLKLFARLYNIDSGSVEMDGENIYNYSLSSLRDQFAVVSQESFFFNDTIAANLVFDADISKEEMIDAAKKACIHDFILTLKDGYETIIEEMGKNLSGGQKQRLSIARALLKKSPILLLDEATSSLDAISEKMIGVALNQMKGEITQVIVAHRLSTVQHADKIIFLEQGRIKSYGSLQEVIETAPSFSAMWEASKLEKLEPV